MSPGCEVGRQAQGKLSGLGIFFVDFDFLISAQFCLGFKKSNHSLLPTTEIQSNLRQREGENE